MKRRRLQTENGEFAFVDVAMGIAGPAILLMIMFMIVSGDHMQETCQRVRSNDETAPYIERIGSWLAVLEAEINATRTLIEEHCAGASIEPPSESSQFSMPPALEGVCLSSANNILEQVGSSRADLSERVAKRNRLSNTLAKCLLEAADAGCQSPDANRLQSLAAIVSQGEMARRDRNRTLSQLIEQQCDTTSLKASGNIRFIPPALYNICPDAREEILAQADLSQAMIDQTAAVGQALVHQATTCLSGIGDAESGRTDRIQFKTCSTDFLDPKNRDKIMSKVDVRDYFKKLAAEIEPEIAGGNYNRIDIFGHTDSQPIRDRCPNGARDNVELSALRAIAFQRALKNGFKERSPRIYDDIQRGRLRIYPVGVGAQEPKVATARTPNEHRENRRIEIRYARDTIGAGQE